MHGADEVVELSARKASLAPGCPVAADVTGVGPATDRRERDAQVARSLRAREHELAAVAWKHCTRGHVVGLVVVGFVSDFRGPLERRRRTAGQPLRRTWMLLSSAGGDERLSAAELCGRFLGRRAPREVRKERSKSVARPQPAARRANVGSVPSGPACRARREGPATCVCKRNCTHNDFKLDIT